MLTRRRCEFIFADTFVQNSWTFLNDGYARPPSVASPRLSPSTVFALTPCYLPLFYLPAICRMTTSLVLRFSSRQLAEACLKLASEFMSRLYDDVVDPDLAASDAST